MEMAEWSSKMDNDGEEEKKKKKEEDGFHSQHQKLTEENPFVSVNTDGGEHKRRRASPSCLPPISDKLCNLDLVFALPSCERFASCHSNKAKRKKRVTSPYFQKVDEIVSCDDKGKKKRKREKSEIPQSSTKEHDIDETQHLQLKPVISPYFQIHT